MNIVIIGKGKMGALLAETAQANGHAVLGNADAFDQAPLLDNLDQTDLVLDFSHPDNLSWVMDAIANKPIALVEGTTGFSDDQKAQLKILAAANPVFFSANYSLGIAVLTKLTALAARVLKEDWDMELVETHHNQKIDAPSGTALAMVEAMDPENEFKKVYGRSGRTGKREKEIGIHALRGGTVPGRHEAHFFGPDEEITLSHNANSRQIFVNGAIKAAEFLNDQPAGFYDMNDLIQVG